MELANTREIRDSINIALQNKLNIIKPIVADISKSQYNRNIVLITTDDFNAALLQNYEEVLAKFFQFKSSKIDAIWYKILIHDVPIAEFALISGMELLQKEIEIFNPELKLAIKPRWIFTERIRNSGKIYITAVITFDNEQMVKLVMARKIFLVDQ
jgi:hypothetical protein